MSRFFRNLFSRRRDPSPAPSAKSPKRTSISSDSSDTRPTTNPPSNVGTGPDANAVIPVEERRTPPEATLEAENAKSQGMEAEVDGEAIPRHENVTDSPKAGGSPDSPNTGGISEPPSTAAIAPTSNTVGISNSVDELSKIYKGALIFRRDRSPAEGQAIQQPSLTIREADEDIHQPNSEIYNRCRSIILQVMGDRGGKQLISELGGDKAQIMVDYLSEVLDHRDSLSPRDRKHMLHLLAKLAKSAQVFPRSLELEDVQCNLSKHATGGGYAYIYKGEHKKKSVCVKAIQVYEGYVDKNKMRAQAGELILWAHTSHPNVLPFSGIFLSEEKVPRVCIVSPWVENGDLPNYLKHFPNADPIPLVHDIISGLKYLHDFDIIHADLKAANVLVSQTNRAMLTDFGISRIMMTAATSTTGVGVAAGTSNWMAPELFMDDVPVPNGSSDIWAFACTCYEIITGVAPFNQHKNIPALIRAFMKGDIVPIKPTANESWNKNKEKVWSVAERCWKSDPASRPTAEELLNLVTNLNTSDNRLPEPEYRRAKTKINVDYNRVLDVLNQIENS